MSLCPCRWGQELSQAATLTPGHLSCPPVCFFLLRRHFLQNACRSVNSLVLSVVGWAGHLPDRAHSIQPSLPPRTWLWSPPRAGPIPDPYLQANGQAPEGRQAKSL